MRKAVEETSSGEWSSVAMGNRGVVAARGSVEVVAGGNCRRDGKATRSSQEVISMLKKWV